MKIRTFRPDAHVERHPSLRPNALLMCGVIVSEFFTIGRIAPLGTKSEVEFKPNTVYEVFTGISLDGVTDPSQLVIRAPRELYKKCGLSVERVEIGDRNEIIVFVRVFDRWSFKRLQTMFEVFVNQPPMLALTPAAALPTSYSHHTPPTPPQPAQGGVKIEAPARPSMIEEQTVDLDAPQALKTATASMPETGGIDIVNEETAPSPDPFVKEGPTKLREAPRPAAAAAHQPMSDAAVDAKAAKEVDDWLNEPDEKGKVVGNDGLALRNATPIVDKQTGEIRQGSARGALEPGNSPAMDKLLTPRTA